MFLNVTVHNLQDGPSNVQLDEVPDCCPICHRNVHPKFIRGEYLLERKMVQAIYRCTNQKCQELFIGTYPFTNSSKDGRQLYKLISVSPKKAQQISFSEIIIEVSPAFVEIYNQALAAESQDLTQLVGIGIRKALEFLVKDFAVRENPEQEDEIRKEFLGKCINTYLNDANLKACAKRAVWLGNDEAHYTRKWEDKDISDLKLLVKLTTNWIENVILTENYIADMSEGTDPT